MSVFETKWDLSVSDQEDSEEWYLAGRGSNATGCIMDGEAILVKAGSIIAPTITEGFQRGYLDLRHELVQNGIIVDNVFITDYTFDSVSAAAAVILGRSANGRKEWTKLDGRTIAQVGH